MGTLWPIKLTESSYLRESSGSWKLIVTERNVFMWNWKRLLCKTRILMIFLKTGNGIPLSKRSSEFFSVNLNLFINNKYIYIYVYEIFIQRNMWTLLWKKIILFQKVKYLTRRPSIYFLIAISVNRVWNTTLKKMSAQNVIVTHG